MSLYLKIIRRKIYSSILDFIDINRREIMSQVFKQDLTDTSDRPGGIFFVELF